MRLVAQSLIKTDAIDCVRSERENVKDELKTMGVGQISVRLTTLKGKMFVSDRYPLCDKHR